MKNFLSLLPFGLLLFLSCSEEQRVDGTDRQLSTDNLIFTWTLDSLDLVNGASYITHTITNLFEDTIGQNWVLYYNQIMGGPDQNSLPPSIQVDKFNGTFFGIMPTDEFLPLPPNQSFSYSYKMNVPVIRKSDTPMGMYVVMDNGNPLIINNVNAEGLEIDDLGRLPVETASTRFEQNKIYGKEDLSLVEKLIPFPKEIMKQEGALNFGNKLTFYAHDNLNAESEWLVHLLSNYVDIQKNQNESDAVINIKMDESADSRTGAYSLSVDEKGITIESENNEGILNGISTLAQLLAESDDNDEYKLEYMNIVDWPDYEYRGLMLDVSRHFHSVKSVKSILDLMSLYKLNKFHFHLGDDEGWRVEINDLPELTEVGARRGHTMNEVKSGHLQPAYGSGPHPSHSYGSGWYTREEYIDILKYAAARHIEVIPEFDMPGHARAAIMAMKVRYDKYMAEGNKEAAEQYLLSDPNDQSVYNSAQGYGDNSFCVCRESTFTFVEKVLQEVIKMHEEAGAPLKTFHSGGDEVAYGSWQKSPICQDFIKANNESISNTDELQAYFTQRYMSIIAKYGLVTAGWEEYVLKNSSEGHHGKELNPKFFGQNMQPYVWNATWGWGREDMAYQLANAGYRVVMCNSAQLYFDMAYNMDPDESGLMWTGMVDATNPFFLIPENIYSIPQKKNNVGAVVSNDLFDGHARLTDEGKENFYGIQGHLWSETVTSNDKIHYYLFPKTLSLSERAWNAYPEWDLISDINDRWEIMQKDWGTFANKVGQQHLAILDHVWEGVNYRIPLPGIKVIDNKIHANVRFPGLTLRYTSDGSSVNENSTVYNDPFEIEEGVSIIRMKAFNTKGRSSRVSILKL